MKYIISFLIAMLIITTIANAGLSLNKITKQNKNINETTLAYLLSLNLEYYKGKPVDSLLAVLPANYSYRRIGGWDNSFYAKRLAVRYPDSSLVIIIVKDFTHLTQRYSRERNWDFNLFKKEKIFCIAIYKTGKGLLKPDEECPYE